MQPIWYSMTMVVISIVVLFFMIVKLKIHPFITMTLVAVGLALAMGMPLTDRLSNFNDAGFRVPSRYFRISGQVMLKTWTVGVTIMGCVTATIASLLWLAVS